MASLIRNLNARITLFGLFAVTIPIFSPNASVFRGNGPVGFMPYFIYSMFAALAVVSLACAIKSRRTPTVLSRGAGLVASVLYALSIVGFVALSLGAAIPYGIVAAIGAVCGATIVFITVQWASYLSALAFREALVCSCLLCIATAVMGIVFQALPLFVRGGLYVAFAAVGGIAPFAMKPVPPYASCDAPSPDEAALSTRNLLHMLHLPVIGLVIYTFMMSVNKVLAWGVVDAEYLGAIIAAVLIAPVLLVRTDKPAASFVYRVVAPVIGGIVIVFVSFPADTLPHGAALWLVYIFLSALAIIALSQIIAVLHAGEFYPAFVVGCSLFLGGVVSLCGLMWVNVFGGLSAYEPLIYVLIAVYCALMLISLGLESWCTITAVSVPSDDVDAGVVSVAGGSHASAEEPRSSTVPIPGAIASKLTRRETEILSYLGRGHSNAFIAEKLFISESTVRTHVKHIYQKLEVHSREELFVLLDHARA